VTERRGSEQQIRDYWAAAYALLERFLEEVEASLGPDLTPDELIRLDAAAAAVLVADSEEKRREVIVGGIADWGLRFTEYLALLARTAPELYAPLAAAAHELVATWFGGHLATERADEAEARARYLLEALDRTPAVARIAAQAVLALPPGHRLRDEERIRAALDDLLRYALDKVATTRDDEVLAEATDHALSAITGLVKHELAPPDRITTLLDAGRELLKSRHLRENGDSFRVAAVAHLRNAASAARDRNEPELADRLDSETADLLAPLADAEIDPIKRQLLSVLLGHAEGDRDRTATAAAALASIPREGRTEEAASLLGSTIMAKHAGEDHQVVDALAPILPALEHRYLSAVLEEDVAMAGEAVRDAALNLAFAYAHRGEAGNAVAALDRAKSLRFRHQSLLRASPLGDFLRELEADIHAVKYRLPPPYSDPRRQKPVEELLETYRQARAKIGDEDVPRPGVAEIADVLGDDEAAVVLGVGKRGTILAVIRRGDGPEPMHGEILAEDVQRELYAELLDHSTGWWTWLGFRMAFIEPRRALVRLLRTADRLVGERLAEVLAGSKVRRVTVVPHELLHVVPWWALPSLSSFEVMTAPSAEQLVTARRTPRALEATALVVGNPTGDLPLAAAEAAEVAASLRSLGCAVDVVQGAAATQETLARAMEGRSILHFSGHGRSDVSAPMRSALEIQAAVDAETHDGPDLLLGLAASAEWQKVHRFDGTKWIDSKPERQADIAGHGHLEERIRHADRRVELRLDYGAEGTLLGQYALEGFTDEDETLYGRRYRLSELWSAGDMLIESCFRECGLAFVSSCEAGAGGAPNVDEFSGLPAALQLAGVSTVVSPLWPVGVEMAAVFAHLFYGELAQAGEAVDVLALVHETRHRLRTMGREEAAAILDRLRAAADDPLARFLLEAAARRALESDDVEPFCHPYDWAAFQATGAPELTVPFAKALAGPAAARAPTAFELPPDAEPRSEARTSFLQRDAFALGAEAEILAETSTDPALEQIAADGLYKRGLAHRRAGHDPLAVADFSRAVEIDPEHLDARAELAQASLGRGDAAAAVAWCDEILARAPDHLAALLMRALAQEGLGRAAAAEADLDALLTHDSEGPLAVPAYQARARLREARDASEAAVADLDEAIRLQPETPALYLLRAAAQLSVGRFDAAVTDTNRALFFTPDDAAGHALRGLALCDGGRLEEAVRELERAVELEEDVMQHHYALADALDRLNEHERALASYSRALEIEATPTLYSDRGLTRVGLGDYDGALEDYGAALQLDPAHLVARYNRACASSLKRESGTIVDDLRTVFAGDPSLRENALEDPDLEWARRYLSDVQDLLTMRGPDGDAG
jgi:tetratricopeptide (TPR) repeat protein